MNDSAAEAAATQEFTRALAARMKSMNANIAEVTNDCISGKFGRFFFSIAIVIETNPEADDATSWYRD